MSVAKPPPSFCYLSNFATVLILLPCQFCYRACDRERNKLLQKSKRKKEEHATRKVEAQKKEQLRRWEKRPLTKKENKFEQKSKTRN